MKSKFPSKINNGILEDEINYCEKLINVIEENEVISSYPNVKELVQDDIEQFNLSKDVDAKVGHKTAEHHSLDIKLILL